MRVLIVEDEIALADALQYILLKNGYQVDVVNNGIDGEAYACSGIYDVIVLDRMLPGREGVEILKAIGARTNLRNNIKWYAVAVLVYPFIMLISIIIAKAGGGLTIGKFESGALFALMLTTFFGSCIKNIFE